MKSIININKEQCIYIQILLINEKDKLYELLYNKIRFEFL